MSDGFSRYDVYTEIQSLYCYKDSPVLINRYGIHTLEDLKRVEQDIVGARQIQMQLNPVKGKFTSTHLCNIHRFLFGDIYPFAGNFRKETIKKGETTFLNERHIPGKLKTLLNQLHQENLLNGLAREELINRLAYYMAELNYIHPFREGNGRATREFFRLLIEKNGYKIDWIGAGREKLLDAMIQSVYNTSGLCIVLNKCLRDKD